MNTELEQADDVARLHLRGDLDIYSAVELKQSLLSAVARFPRLEVDLAEVGGIDGAGLQILALAVRESNRAGASLRLSGNCASFSRLVDLLHMQGHFAGAQAGSDAGAHTVRQA